MFFSFAEDALPERDIKNEADKDVRVTRDDEDNIVEAKNEFYDGDQDNDKNGT